MRVVILTVVAGGAVMPVAHGTAQAETDKASRLVEDMVQIVGGMGRLYALRDVQYTYTYRKPQAKDDVSVERYVFDGELSWARYTKREAATLPQLKGKLVQGFDGKHTWMTLDGKPVVEPQALKLADFLRKTNYYWFAMMPKLLDPGVRHAYQGTREVDGIRYEIVKTTFDEGVGDVRDTYLLYINPATHLVDQFLFTVMDFGMAKPMLMRVRYKTVRGVKLPAVRRYAPSNWRGEVDGKAQWTEELMTDIKFDNGFERSLFAAPKVRKAGICAPQVIASCGVSGDLTRR